MSNLSLFISGYAEVGEINKKDKRKCKKLRIWIDKGDNNPESDLRPKEKD